MDNTKKTREERPLGLGGIIGSVIFLLSFIPYIMMAYGAFTGVPKGLFSVDNCYGFEAVGDMLLWLTVIPVIPVCLLYQILFGLLYIRKSVKKLKIAASVTAAASVIILLLPCLVFEGKKQVLINDSEAGIRAHLASVYGDEFARSVKIKVEDYDDKYFLLINPVTEKPASLHYSLTDPDKIYDDVIKHINNEELNQEFGRYVVKKLGLPDDISVVTSMESADLTGFKKGDDPAKLFDSATFRIKSVTITKEDWNANQVLPEVQRTWKELIPLIGDHHFNSLKLVMNTKTGPFAAAQIDYPANFNSFRPVGIISKPYEGVYFLD